MMPLAFDLISTFEMGSTLPVATTDRTMVSCSTVASRDGSKVAFAGVMPDHAYSPAPAARAPAVSTPKRLFIRVIIELSPDLAAVAAFPNAVLGRSASAGSSSAFARMDASRATADRSTHTCRAAADGSTNTSRAAADRSANASRQWDGSYITTARSLTTGNESGGLTGCRARPTSLAAAAPPGSGACPP